MKNRMIKVGAIVPRLKVADVNYNVEQIISCINETRDCGIVVFPELCLCGYTCADLFGNDILLQACENGLKTIASSTKEIQGLMVVVGLPVRYHNHLYNCAAYVSEGKVCGLVPKINIPNYSEFYEERWFTSGYDIVNTDITFAGSKIPFGKDLLFECGEVIVGTDICEDLWVADKPSTHACIAGANIIVNPSGSDEIIGKQEYRRQMVQQQSAACYCGYIYVSNGMDESSTDLVFSGHSMIASNGNILKENIFPHTTSIQTTLIDLDTIIHNRTHQNTYGQNTLTYRLIPTSIKMVKNQATLSVDECKQVLDEENYFVAKNPFVPSDNVERGKRCQSILEIQANGLATRVRSTGIHNLVIGISGGLDSTLALLVCHEAKKIEPKIHIIAYTLPNRGNTTSHTYNNAIQLMKCLNVEIREVAIESIVKQHLIDLGHGEEYQGEGDTTYENAQARMRTYILMNAANMENGLVVGTGDLSELALGWCTYNGDHMSMYGVNTSVPKTLVQYICRSYGETCNDDSLKEVLFSICDTPITPELTPNKGGQIAQKTEEKIGKYDLNDFFLFYTLRYGFEPTKILAFALHAYPQLTKEEVKQAEIRFYNRFFHQQFKRSCLPDGPKVGSVTLSPRGDWRMPSDASCNLWIEELKKA